MNSPSREYDPEDRPRFNEWVCVDSVHPVSNGNGTRASNAVCPDYTPIRTSGSMRVLPGLLFCLLVGLAGGYFLGRGMAYPNRPNVAHQEEMAGADAAEARKLELKVKSAIAANPMLNDESKRSLVNVKVADQVVYLPGSTISRSRMVILTGNVGTSEIKSTAARVAEAAIKAAGAHAEVVNKLKLVNF